MTDQPSVSPQDIDLDIPGMTLAGRVWGPADGQPVLATHGWLDNAATFARLAPLLADCRIVAIDFPGHGRSEHRPAGQAYHFVDLVPTIFDAADALGWQTFSMLCHSMGAAAATLAAGTFPERIERMVLIDGLGPWSTAPDKTPEQLAEGLVERKALLDKNSRTFTSREAATKVIAELYGLSRKNAAPLIERGLVGREDGGFSFSYDLMLRGASLMRLTEAQVMAFLERIACPTLLLRPTNGWPADAEQMQRRTGAIEPLRTVEVEGNHHVHLEHPERLASTIQDFLAD